MSNPRKSRPSKTKIMYWRFTLLRIEFILCDFKRRKELAKI